MLKNMKKSTKSNVITLGIVVGFYVLIQILSAAGALTNSFSGQLVPICAYVIMAVSLNLTVGMLGELSLGHAGFMSVGAPCTAAGLRGRRRGGRSVRRARRHPRSASVR